MTTVWARRPQRRFAQLGLLLSLLLLLLMLEGGLPAEAQFLPGEADSSQVTSAQRTARANCKASYNCANFPYSRTPFGLTNVRYSPATGKLCYQIQTNRSCAKCSYACKRVAGWQALYQLAPDSGVVGTVSSTSIRPTGGTTARMSPPTCLPKVGIASKVAVKKPAGVVVQAGVLMRKGVGPASLCVQYPKGTPFRRIGKVAGGSAAAPNQQTCCTSGSAYKPMTATLQVWARGAGPVKGSGVGCQACTNAKVSLATGTIQGNVWMDSNGNDRYTLGIDEGFEGAAVNLWRYSGSVKTFMGCTQTNGQGAFKFSRVVADTYSVQVVKQDAGPRASFRFARKSTASMGSAVNQGSGMTSTFQLAGGTKTVNALVQIVAVSSNRRRRRLQSDTS